MIDRVINRRYRLVAIHKNRHKTENKLIFLIFQRVEGKAWTQTFRPFTIIRPTSNGSKVLKSQIKTANLIKIG